MQRRWKRRGLVNTSSSLTAEETCLEDSQDPKSVGGGQVRNVSDSGRLIRSTGNISCENCNRMFST